MVPQVLRFNFPSQSQLKSAIVKQLGSEEEENLPLKLHICKGKHYWFSQVYGDIAREVRPSDSPEKGKKDRSGACTWKSIFNPDRHLEDGDCASSAYVEVTSGSSAPIKATCVKSGEIIPLSVFAMKEEPPACWKRKICKCERRDSKCK